MQFCLIQQITLLYVWVIATEALRIGSFNIQVFGRSKASKASVMDKIVQILKRYDLVAIEEIRDKSGKAFDHLLKQLNSQSLEPYMSYESIGLGRTRSKEQYGIIYNPVKLRLSDVGVFPDMNNKFERAPLHAVVHPRETNLPPFGMIVVHLDPDTVPNELEALYKVAEQFRMQHNLKDILLMGDMNADCRYLSKRKMSKLSLRKDPQYYWIIPDRYDTTVHQNNCALDRMIVYGTKLRNAIQCGKATAFRFDSELRLNTSLARQISDHYPIEIELRTSPNDATICRGPKWE